MVAFQPKTSNNIVMNIKRKHIFLTPLFLPFLIFSMPDHFIYDCSQIKMPLGLSHIYWCQYENYFTEYKKGMLGVVYLFFFFLNTFPNEVYFFSPLMSLRPIKSIVKLSNVLCSLTCVYFSQVFYYQF